MVESLLLFHGTTEDFEEFDLSKVKDGRAYGRGFYFTNSMSIGRQYSDGRDPIVARVTLDSPYLVDLDAPFEESIARRRIFRPNHDARERLIAAGYDGVLIRQEGYIEVVAFHASQIQSHGRRPDLTEPEDTNSITDSDPDAEENVAEENDGLSHAP